MKLIKNKDKIYKRYIKEQNISIKDQLLSKYKQQKNEITKLIRNSKKMHYNEYFSKNSNNLKKLRTGVNRILNRNEGSSNTSVCIEIDNDGNVNTISNPEGIANAFNSHYTKYCAIIKSNDKRSKINKI